MSVTLGPNGFTSDTNTLQTKINNTDVVENHTLAGGSTNPNVKMSIKKATPSWSGYVGGGTGNGEVWSNYTVTGAQRHNSANSGFDASTGRFTAPIAGTYIFNMFGITATSGDTDIRYAIRRNGNTNSSHCISSSGGGNYSPTCVSVTWYMAVGDYADCSVYEGGSAHGGDWNGFSGLYVG